MLCFKHLNKLKNLNIHVGIEEVIIDQFPLNLIKQNKKSIEILILESSRSKDEFPIDIFYLKLDNLIELSIDCNITDNELNNISYFCPLLKKAKFDSEKVTKIGYDSLSKCKYLKDLEIEISDEILKYNGDSNLWQIQKILNVNQLESLCVVCTYSRWDDFASI